MEFVLIIAAAYNFLGAFSMWFQFADNNYDLTQVAPDYLQYRFFTGGTAFLFGVIYLYIFFVPDAVMPLLVFGVALKMWSFFSSLICYKKFGFPRSDFFKVGVGNLVFALLFLVYMYSL
ncbi:hypothetical protein A9Q99_11385 [Gammaproteobacteria bacterium 45_16_T64]|nr:hypothetical protein A9Q99_11385 [Gammaproteobacteria bacterium 45_16_T64]